MSYRRGGRGGRGGGANHDEDRPTWKPRGGGGSSSFGGAGGRGRGGRGGEGRGKGGGGGRGRGRGAFSYTDMSSMAHDYSESSSKLRLSEPELDVDVDDEVANGQTTSGQAAASQQRSKARDSTSATVEGYTRPKPSFKPVFTLQPESDVAVQATRHQPSQSSLPDFIPARTEAAPINQSMSHQAAVSTYHAKRTAHLGIGAQQQQQQPFAHSGGYGGQGSTFRAPTFGARQPERSRAGYPSDPNLLVPMTFVKSTKRIEPTMDGKEHDELLHKRKMEQAFGKDTLPQHLVGLGEHKENVPAQPISTTMQTSLSSSSSRSSRSQMATPLSPHAKPFHSPRLAAAPVDQIESHQPFYAFLRGSPRQASDKGKQRAVLPVESDPEPLFFIDSVGERATTTGPDDEAEAESDTEEIYPRHVESRAAPATAVPPPMPSSHSAFPSLPDRFAAQSSISVPEPPAVPVHLPLKPYAQTITDDISYAPAVTAAAVSTELPPAAVEFLRSATASFNSAASRSKDAPPARKVSAKQKRKEAKERKKERKRAKKENRRPAHSLDKEKEARRPRVGESDVEWGSDGPPDMGDESDSGDSKDGDVQMPGGAQSSVLRANVAKGAKPAGRKGRGKRDDAIEAALADILAQPADSDDDDSDAREESQRAMRSFVDSFSMRAGEHLTLDDLDDLDRMRVEDGEGEYTTTAQGSGSDEDEEDDLRYEQKAIMKEFVRAEVTAKQPENTTGESSAREEFPVYVPELAEPPIDSDMDDSRNEIWKTDDESDLEDEEAARVKWQLKGDRFMRDQRAQLADSVEGSVSVGRDLEMKIEIADETTILIVSDDDEEAEQEDEDEEESESESEEDDEDEFDIDDMLEDDIDALIMSGLQPSRRKANKQPPSTKDTFFDAHLQKQWQADRQKKALKKQERALARAEKNPNRSNKRKAKRAAGQARGFSARDDEGDMMLEFDLNGSARIPEFHKINEDLRKFIENSGSMQYELPPMDKKFRYAIHDLAAAYNLKSKSRGVGRARHNVLYRTQHTTVRGANMRKVQKFLSITATWSSGANKSFSYDHPRGNGKGGGGGRKPGNANAGGGNAFVTRNYEGALVGEGADRIDSTNLGHQLLAKMGWTEGMQIGRNGGIDEPISAVIKTSKAGLGSGYVRYNRGVSSSMQVPAAGGSGGNTGWGTPVAMEG